MFHIVTVFYMFKAKTYLTQNELDNLIKPALDYLLTLRYKSGNLPSSLCNDRSKMRIAINYKAGFTQRQQN